MLLVGIKLVVVMELTWSFIPSLDKLFSLTRFRTLIICMGGFSFTSVNYPLTLEWGGLILAVLLRKRDGEGENNGSI